MQSDALTALPIAFEVFFHSALGASLRTSPRLHASPAPASMRPVLADLPPPALAALLAAVGIAAGWLFATLLRKRDHQTFVLARAPSLPIRALAEHDDAWLRGVVCADAPLRCPWFDTDCVAYRYRIERKVTRMRRDKDGKTHTETSWDTEYEAAETIDFDLDDGARIRVALTAADNEAMGDAGPEYETTSRRHSAHVLPIGTEVSVLGVRRDDGSFGPLAGVPLLVTRLLPRDRVRASARGESWLFGLALWFPFAGAAGAAAAALQPATLLQWLAALPFGLLLLVPQWWLLTYNRLVRLRQQVKAAQQQVAVELAFRSDLVPNLVAVVRATAGHERELLERLAAIRSGNDLDANVRTEGAAVATARQVLVLHERYPALRADALYRDLHERLWAVEEKLAHTRGFYNDIVTEWNDRVAQFPSLLVARTAGWREAAVFAIEADESLPPRLA